MEYDKSFMMLSSVLESDLINFLIEKTADEIQLNSDGRVFVKFSGGSTEYHSDLTDVQAIIIIKTIASLNGHDLNNISILDCEIASFGCRFSAVLPPVVKRPVFCIRILHAVNMSFEDLLRQNFLNHHQKENLQKILREKSNVLVCGQTGCGKTSFINSMLSYLAENQAEERIICIEDTPELKLKNENSLNLYSNEKTDMSALVKASLRLSPDRIVIGEIRSKEALDMLDALSTGHSGCIASMHAGSAKQCLNRLKLMASRNENAPKNLDELIALSVNVIIVLCAYPFRHVKSISYVNGLNNGEFILSE